MPINLLTASITLRKMQISRLADANGRISEMFEMCGSNVGWQWAWFRIISTTWFGQACYIIAVVSRMITEECIAGRQSLKHVLCINVSYQNKSNNSRIIKHSTEWYIFFLWFIYIYIYMCVCVCVCVCLYVYVYVCCLGWWNHLISLLYHLIK